ncbi:MAG: tetratricopeptide repeat protein [Candidatus Omnitrophota bacterium]
MKKLIISLTVIAGIFWGMICSSANAERLYYKDGLVKEGKIIYRIKDSIWIQNQTGALGFSREDIERVENDDGSISKYDYESLCGLVQEFIKEEKYKEAVELCGVLLGSFPESIHLHYLRGILNHESGDSSKAMGDYKFLVKHGVSDGRIFNNIGVIYANNEEYQQAMDYFIKAIELAPDAAEFHHNLAELFMQTKDYKHAIDEYSKVIEKQPDNVQALYNLGIAYEKEQNYLKAKEQWEKVLAVDSNDRDAKNALDSLSAKK